MKLLGVLLSVLLAGCSVTLPKGVFENRLACSLDGKEVYFLSKYGWVSIGAEIASQDVPQECRRAAPQLK